MRSRWFFLNNFLNVFWSIEVSMNKRFLLTALCASLSSVAPQAMADEITTSFDVLIEIVASCEINTAGVADIDFGQHGIFATDVDQTTELKVTCTKASPYSIALNDGQNASTGGDVNTRRMVGIDTLNTSDYVSYNLYSDTGRSTVWGNTLESNVVASTGTGDEQTHTIYGRVPSTNHTVGQYKDTVTATVTF